MKSLVKEKKASMVGLVETKVKQENMIKILQQLPSYWMIEKNYEYSPKGRI